MSESDQEGKFPTEEGTPGQTAPMSPKDPVERGLPIILTKDWLELARRKMKERKMTQAALALAVGISEPSVSRLFANNASTAHVSKVAELLGIDDPVAQLMDPEVQRWVYAGLRYRAMNAAVFERLLAKLEAAVEPFDDLIDAMTSHEK